MCGKANVLTAKIPAFLPKGLYFNVTICENDKP